MPYTRYGPLITFYKICIINIINNALEKSFEKMTILTKYVFYNKSALVDCHSVKYAAWAFICNNFFFTHAMHLYAKMCHAFD